MPKMAKICINELQKLDLNKQSEYVKMMIELTGVIVAKNLEEYKKSENETVKKVANMILKYTQEEIEELQKRYDDACDQLNTALIMEMQERAKEEGKAEGAANNLADNIKTMYSNGFDAETIAKALSLDLSFVKKVLSEQ